MGLNKCPVGWGRDWQMGFQKGKWTHIQDLESPLVHTFWQVSGTSDGQAQATLAAHRYWAPTQARNRKGANKCGQLCWLQESSQLWPGSLHIVDGLSTYSTARSHLPAAKSKSPNVPYPLLCEKNGGQREAADRRLQPTLHRASFLSVSQLIST
jgi:hypothetical protein